MSYYHWMKGNDNEHLIRLYFKEKRHGGEAWKLCLSCSAAFGVGEGESRVSPTRCSQAVWYLHRRLLYGLGSGTAGLFVCI